MQYPRINSMQNTFRLVVHTMHEYADRFRVEYRLNTIKVIGSARSVKRQITEKIQWWPENALYQEWKNASEEQRAEVLPKLLNAVRVHAKAVVFEELAENNRELVETIVGEVGRCLPTFRGKAKFGSWVHKIALNHVFGEMRNRIRRRAVFNEGVEVDDEMPQVNPTDPDSRIYVEQLADGLSEEEQLIYWAKYQGYTSRDIAEQLDKSEDAVESQWRRITGKIRERDGERRNGNGSGN